MGGNNNGAARKITVRDLVLLTALVVAKVIDRELAKEIASFHSTTRANDRLLKLTRAGLLSRFFVNTSAGGRKALYALSPKGAREVQVQRHLIQRKRDSLLIGDLFIEHQLAVNSIWIQVAHRPIPLPNVTCVRWISFPEVLSKSISLVPDGYFELKSASGVLPMFCEVDRGTETLKVWDKKISLYLQLAVTEEFQRLFGQGRFRVLVAASSERRLQNLRRQTLKQTDKIFWFTTLRDINQRGLFANIWLRPDGAERLALL
jgi:predicted transcriptional regulator